LKNAHRQSLAALILGAALTLGCRSVLGIHDGTLAATDPPNGLGGTPVMSAEGTGGHGAEPAGTGGGDGATDGPGGSAPTPGGSGGARDGGEPGDGQGTGGGMSTVTGALGSAGGSGGVGNGDSGTTGGTSATDGGAGSDGTDARPSDSRMCASPWNASAVPAYLLSIAAGGSTACSFAGKDLPALVAGVDTANFRKAAACGACLRVRAITGGASVVVPVVEVSGSSGLLLSRAAMDQVAAGADRATVDWTLVPCDVGTAPVRYRIKDGTNASYLAVQVRNTRYPVASLSIVTTAGPIPLTLQSYGYWETGSAGAGPVTFRLTDINGQTFDEPGVRLTPQSEFVGKGQFPLCD